MGMLGWHFLWLTSFRYMVDVRALSAMISDFSIRTTSASHNASGPRTVYRAVQRSRAGCSRLLEA